MGKKPAIACGTIYEIAPGDTLFEVADRAYADGWRYKDIFRSNRDFLPNSGTVEIGDKILIPCLDGSGPQSRTEAMAQAATPVPGDPPPAALEPADEAVANEPAAPAAPAPGLPACAALYTVRRGDMLSTISTKYYGTIKRYTTIFEANRDLLPDVASIEVGDELLIPCLDGTAPRTRAEARAQGLIGTPAAPEVATAEAAAEPAEDVAEPMRAADMLLQTAAALAQHVVLPAPLIVLPGETDVVAPPPTEDPVETAALGAPEAAPAEVPVRPIRFLTGSGFAPYADAAAPGGGMIADLLTAAVDAAATEQASEVAFVNDWSAHLKVLLPAGAFDVGFPWYKPNCDRVERLSDDARTLCDGYEFSNAIVELSFGFYTRAGDPLADIAGPAGLRDRRLCRPAAQFVFDLGKLGLAEPDLLIETLDTAEDCFAQLIRQRVDAVVLARSDARARIPRLGIAERVAEIDALATAQSLHAVAPKSNPKARAFLDLIDQGLAELMTSGRWFEIVARHQSLRLAAAE